jgi:hypothetical protein
VGTRRIECGWAVGQGSAVVAGVAHEHLNDPEAGETFEDLADALGDLARNLGRSDEHDFEGPAPHDGDFVPSGAEDFGGADGAKSDAELISLIGADEVDLGRGVNDEEGFAVGVGVEEAAGKYVTAHDEE